MDANQKSVNGLLQTYFFWAAVSLLNFDLLCGLAIPFLVTFYLKFFPFLAVPVALSIAGVILIYKRLSIRAPLVLNAILLVLILIFGDLFKNSLIWWHLHGHAPQCVDYGSFSRSAFSSNRKFFGNGMYEENGKLFLWSYSGMTFFEASPGLSANFSCMK